MRSAIKPNLRWRRRIRTRDDSAQGTPLLASICAERRQVKKAPWTRAGLLVLVAAVALACQSSPEPQPDSAETGATSEDNGDGEPTAPTEEACAPLCQTLATEPRIIVTGDKGQGPVRSFFPGLDGRPQVTADQRTVLVEALDRLGKLDIPAEPAPGQQPEPTMTPWEIPDDPLEAPPGSRKGYKDRHNLRMAIEPWVTITPQGRMTLQWETWVETPPSFVHFGLRIPDQILDYPRYRKASKESGHDRRKEHSVSRDLDGFESRHFDVVGFEEQGGTITYRIEYLDTVGGITLYHDDEFAFVKDGKRFDYGVTIKQGPHVDLPAPDGMTVSFDTDVATRAALLVVPPDGGDPIVFDSPDAGTHHEIQATGLQPDTLYTYRVGAVDARGVHGERGDYAFRTAPAEPRPFRFAFMSDSRSGLGGAVHMQHGVNAEVLREFTGEAVKLGADFLIFAGDMIAGYTTEVRELELQYESWKRATGPAHRYIPFFEGMGNHDYILEHKEGGPRVDMPSPNSSEEMFARAFVNPTNGPPPERDGLPPYTETAYSYDYAGAHFVSVNTNYWMSSRPGPDTGNREGNIMDGQMAWLEADLQAARERGVSWIFVFTHEPGFPNGGHVGDGMYWDGKITSINEMRTKFWTLMSEHRVAAVFHGDEHNYSRLLIDEQMDPAFTHPVWQIISGGGGAPFYGRERTKWADRVAKFTPLEHWIMVDVLDANQAVLTVFGPNGETLDRLVIEQ